jgi:hypothetical protein
MADKKDYPNRRVLSLEEVEAVAGGTIARRSMSLITIEGSPERPYNSWICSKCKRNFRTKEDLEAHESSGICGWNTNPNNNK